MHAVSSVRRSALTRSGVATHALSTTRRKRLTLSMLPRSGKNSALFPSSWRLRMSKGFLASWGVTWPVAAALSDWEDMGSLAFLEPQDADGFAPGVFLGDGGMVIAQCLEVDARINLRFPSGNFLALV